MSSLPQEMELKELGDPHPLLDYIHKDMILVAGYEASMYLFDTDTPSQKVLEWSVGKIRLLQSLENPSRCRVEFLRGGVDTFMMYCDIKTMFQVFQVTPKSVVWRIRDDPGQPEFFRVVFHTEKQCLEFIELVFTYCDNAPHPSTLIVKEKTAGRKWCVIT